MIHSLWAAGDVWESAEYAAGYRARMSEIPSLENANKTWRCGWEDADTEILEVERHRCAIAEGREDDYPETWALLLDLGGDARVNGLPFRRMTLRTLERGLDISGHQPGSVCRHNGATVRKQLAICCPCGDEKILALGLCASCYSMKRQDEEYYGGLREVVLDRDDRQCRACPNLLGRKLVVHHRVPGVSKLELMITLCTACHAIVERTQMVLSEMTPLLLEL